MNNRGFWHTCVVYILPLLLWMSLIFLMSTPIGAASNTTPVVHSLFQRLFPYLAGHLPAELVDQLDVVIRKGAHVTEYAIFGLLAYRAFRRGRPDFHNRYPALTLIFCFLYASSDEFHQLYVPGRGASVVDVMIDMYGVTIATAISVWRQAAHAQKRLNQTARPTADTL